MTQFASTLYPQTNPTNPALLDFREIHAATGNGLWADAYLFSSSLIEDGYGKYVESQWLHAMDVLAKILAFSDPIERTG